MTTSLFIGRFQPLHNGHLQVIEEILKSGEKLIIGIGSSQKSHTQTNPLTFDERKSLIESVVKNAEIIAIPDINNPKEWFNHVNKLVGSYSKIYTGSDLVKNCYYLKYSPSSLRPELVEINKTIDICASQIREKVKNDQPWENMVPSQVANNLASLDLKSRLTTHPMINSHIFRAYDIRGIAAPEDGSTPDLTEETVYQIGKATATYLKEKYQTKNMAVGCDNRLTGPSLKAAFIKGITEIGLDVTDIGIAISPMIYWSVCAMNFDSATNITASHNPKEYNGLKTVTKNAHSICGDELQEILKIIQQEAYTPAETPGKIEQLNIWPEYQKDLLSKISTKRKLKIVVDAGNGTAGAFAPEFLEKLGHKIIPLYCELDGTFPNHEANPEELENMRDLIAKVQEEHADLGIGFDGDGDRVGIVDEKGHMYSSDFMLLLLARDLLTRLPGSKVVFDVKVSQAIIKKLKELGADPIMCKTGHSFIENKMKEISAPLAGEVSGHLFFGENYYGFDDALLAAGKIAEIISEHTHPLSQMFNDVDKTFMTPEFKAHCPDDQKFAIVESLVKAFTEKYDCITIDGVRVNFDENSWGAVRASNTSPNLTLRFESTSESRLREIQSLMVEELKKHPEVSLDWYKP